VSDAFVCHVDGSLVVDFSQVFLGVSDEEGGRKMKYRIDVGGRSANRLRVGNICNDNLDCGILNASRFFFGPDQRPYAVSLPDKRGNKLNAMSPAAPVTSSFMVSPGGKLDYFTL